MHQRKEVSFYNLIMFVLKYLIDVLKYNNKIAIQ